MACLWLYQKADLLRVKRQGKKLTNVSMGADLTFIPDMELIDMIFSEKLSKFYIHFRQTPLLPLDTAKWLAVLNERKHKLNVEQLTFSGYFGADVQSKLSLIKPLAGKNLCNTLKCLRFCSLKFDQTSEASLTISISNLNSLEDVFIGSEFLVPTRILFTGMKIRKIGISWQYSSARAFLASLKDLQETIGETQILNIRYTPRDVAARKTYGLKPLAAIARVSGVRVSSHTLHMLLFDADDALNKFIRSIFS